MKAEPSNANPKLLRPKPKSLTPSQNRTWDQSFVAVDPPIRSGRNVKHYASNF